MIGACIGIDLGTTNSVVAGVIDRRVRIITDADGHRLHPSVVAFLPNGTHHVGLTARMRRIIDPANTIYSSKRLIGQPFQSAAVQAAIGVLPYRVVEGENQEPQVVTRGGQLGVGQVAAVILMHLKDLAEASLGQRVTHCVVTVPANFSDAQREATRRAALEAGMTPVRVLNEPTAAALAYGQNRQLHQRIAVFDFGGGTFDLTLLAVRGDIFEVVATGGDPFLGGDDMDRAIADMIATRFLREHRIDLRDEQMSLGKLLVIAEQIKMRLSSQDVFDEHVGGLAYGEGGRPLDLDLQLTRGDLEALLRPIVARAIDCTRRVLHDAQIAPETVDEILLAGGATRVPLVQQLVAELFRRVPKAEINPMEVVAVGAALHAHNLVCPDEARGGLLMDVTSHALGIATTGGYAEQLIAKNTPIPTESTRVFSTARDNQALVRIRICQGERARFGENIDVGELTLANLRPASRGQLQIEVSFLIDANGICSVAARDLETNQTAEATLSLLGLRREIKIGGDGT